MSSEVFWMTRDRKDDSFWRTDQTNENDFPHIQSSDDGEVNPPSNAFNISAIVSLRQSLRICSTHNYNDWEIKSTRSVLQVRY